MVDGSIASLFNHSLTSEECITTAICSTTLSEMDNCTIQYGRDPSYQDLGPPINGSFNSSLFLPFIESSTLYYIQITFMLNSETVILMTNYTTGNGEQRNKETPSSPPTKISPLPITNVSFISWIAKIYLWCRHWSIHFNECDSSSCWTATVGGSCYNHAYHDDCPAWKKKYQKRLAVSAWLTSCT